MNYFAADIVIEHHAKLFISRLIKLLFCLFFTIGYGCSALNIKSTVPDQLKLLPPSEGPVASLLKQKITLVSDDQQNQFLLVTRVQTDNLITVVLSATGQKVLTLIYDGLTLTQDNLSSTDIPGEHILTTMQFVLWPQQSIKQYYQFAEGWSLEFTPNQRILLTTLGISVKVDYLNDYTLVENYLHGYQVKIETLEQIDL